MTAPPPAPADTPGRRLATAWDDAADGYVRYFVPRFAPWNHLAVGALRAAGLPGLPPLPPGPVLVPCCGPGYEFDELAPALPGRALVGIDLSAGMLAQARERCAAYPAVRLVQGDAAVVPAEFTPAAAVVSCFGLQQIPGADAALGNWTAALAPGGLLSVVYWPREDAPGEPFARLRDATRAHVAPRNEPDWEARLLDRVRGAGAVVLRDERPSFAMSHASAAAFFDAMAENGPMRALARAQGPGVIAAIRREYLSAMPAGELRHRPAARWILARRA